MEHIDPDKSSALLGRYHKSLSAGAEALSAQGVDYIYVPQSPLMDVTTNTAWLYLAIAKHFILQHYSVYDLISEIPVEGDAARAKAKTINAMLNRIGQSIEQDNVDDFADKVNTLATELGYTTRPEHIQKLLETIQDEKFHAGFHTEDYKHIAITLFVAKGLEFEQVILFADDFPDLSEPSTVYNHYVAATRAKSKLIIVDVDSGYARRFKTGLINTFAQSGLRLDNVMTFVWR